MQPKEPPKQEKKLGYRTPNRFRRNFNRLAPTWKATASRRIPRTQHKV